MVTSLFKTEGLSKPPHNEGENQRVGGLACETGEAEAYLWGLSISPNPDHMLCFQAGSLLAQGVFGVYTLAVHLGELKQTPKSTYSKLQITVSWACRKLVEPHIFVAVQ